MVAGEASGDQLGAALIHAIRDRNPDTRFVGIGGPLMKAAGMDMATTYEAIKISSGTSFVHETESQLILSGSRCVDFTMDLVLKDIGLFQEIAERNGVPLEISPMMIDLMRDGQTRYGDRAQSDRMIERLEEATGLSITAPGFPSELVDDEPEERGAEVRPKF
jgi:3-hydroxyisobutyrate dehydrogenase